MEKPRAQYIYSTSEIVSRFIVLTETFTGPTLYPVQITYSADNATEPPVIRCEVFRHTGDIHHPTEHLFDAVVDQNTTLAEFDGILSILQKLSERITEALARDVPIEAVTGKDAHDGNPDLPF